MCGTKKFYEQEFLQEIYKQVGGKEVYDRLEEEYYAPSESFEFYDPVTKQWFNKSFEPLRNPDEYNQHSEAYTPFGDE